jgi:hypothetical protein
MTERERVRERVAKLLSMTLDRGVTENEAMTAAEKASELMAHWDIEASKLAVRSSRAIQQEATIRKYGSLNIAAPVAHHIAQLCDCLYWRSAPHVDPQDIDLPPSWQRIIDTFVFFGLPADVEIAGYLFDVISNAIDTEIDAYKATPDYQCEIEARVNGRTAITSFVSGMETRLCDRLDAMRDGKRQTVQEATGRSLVIVKEEQIKADFEATGIKLQMRAASYRGAGSASATASGRAAADRVKLSPGIGRGQPPKALR